MNKSTLVFWKLTLYSKRMREVLPTNATTKTNNPLYKLCIHWSLWNCLDLPYHCWVKIGWMLTQPSTHTGENLQNASLPKGKAHHWRKLKNNTSLVAVEAVRETFLALPLPEGKYCRLISQQRLSLQGEERKVLNARLPVMWGVTREACFSQAAPGILR